MAANPDDFHKSAGVVPVRRFGYFGLKSRVPRDTVPAPTYKSCSNPDPPLIQIVGEPALFSRQKLYCYWRRWIVERTIGWLGNFSHSIQIYRAFFHITFFMIVLRRVMQWLLAFRGNSAN
jgi:hypothetical protein